MFYNETPHERKTMYSQTVSVKNGEETTYVIAEFNPEGLILTKAINGEVDEMKFTVDEAEALMNLFFSANSPAGRENLYK
jgi:hypothetical protein